MSDKIEIQYFRKIIINEGLKLYTSFPWRKTKNKFHALTAEIMLQRTGAEQVASVYKDFIQKYKTPDQYLSSSGNNFFKNLGLTWRYKLFKELCKELCLIEKIPENKNELLKLPGVGNYVAASYRSLHLGLRDFIIDSNVMRLYGRYFGFKTNNETRRKKWFIELSDYLTPKNNFKDYNYAILDFTRIICKHKPLCYKCKLNKRCSYFNKK